MKRLIVLPLFAFPLIVRPLLALPVLSMLALSPAMAEPTPVTVRVISQDAKFVGDGTGGARVILRNAETGAVLAEGTTTGGTGDTERIMHSPGRSPMRASAGAAAFEAVLKIDRPTLVQLEARGALGRPASAITVTAQRWMMPGEAVTAGDGWVVELPGLAVTPTAEMIGNVLRISAKVEPQCGCPIAPGGLWPAEDYQVSASLWAGNRRLGDAPLAFAVAPGGFAGSLAQPSPEALTLVIFARNTVTGATGLARLPLKAQQARTQP